MPTVFMAATVCDRSSATHLRGSFGHQDAPLGACRISADLERPVEQVDVVNLYSAVAGTFPISLVPGQPVVIASVPPFVTGKPKLVDRPKLASTWLAAVELTAPDPEPHSRSPGDNRRCAARARAVAVDAAYRLTISRLRHPVSRIRSPSEPPSASH